MIKRIIPDVVPRTKPILLPKSTKVSDAAQLMRSHNVGAVLIVESRKLIGIFTERDVSFRVVAAGQNPRSAILSDVMSSHPETVQAGDTVLLALERMKTHHIRHLPVYEGKELVGVVAVRDILADATKQIATELVRMLVEPPADCRIAGDIMRASALITLPPDAKVREAATLMKESDVSAVLVTKDEKLVGIFTERDVSFRVVSANIDPDTACLTDVMSADPVVVHPGEKCGVVVEKMIAGNFRHLPIQDKGQLVGMLSIRDLYAYIRHTLEVHFEKAMINRARDMISFE